MFRVGQKVVCVDASGNDLVREGVMYTVIRIIPGSFVAHGPESESNRNADEVFLAEVSHNTSSGFYSIRFRPLTDTSIATILARKAPRDSRKWDNRRHVAPKHRVGGKKQKERA